jgi:hypothetical protein
MSRRDALSQLAAIRMGGPHHHGVTAGGDIAPSEWRTPTTLVSFRQCGAQIVSNLTSAERRIKLF